MVGGKSSYTTVESTAILYDPQNEAWSDLTTLADSRTDGAVVALPDGTALIVGGLADDGTSIASVEVYSADNGNSNLVGSMDRGRAGLTATLLNDGTVLIVGGADSPTTESSSAAIYNPGP